MDAAFIYQHHQCYWLYWPWKWSYVFFFLYRYNYISFFFRFRNWFFRCNFNQKIRSISIERKLLFFITLLLTFVQQIER